MTFTANRQHVSFLHKSAPFKVKNLLKYTISYTKKITEILKSHFLKKIFFQIPLLKLHILVNFWARELGEISFDSEFPTIVTLAVTPYRPSGTFHLITSHIFHSIVTKISISLASGPRMSKFEYGPYRTHGLYGNSNTSFEGST